MSIRLKLVLSYIAMLVIPAILSIIAVLIIAFTYTRIVPHEYGNSALRSEVFDRNDKPEIIFESVKIAAENNPKSLSVSDYIRKIDKSLKNYNAGIAIRKKGTFIYSSSNLNGISLNKLIPTIESNNNYNGSYKIDKGNKITKEKSIHFEPVKVNNKIYVTRGYEYNYAPDVQGTVFLVEKINPEKELRDVFFSAAIIAVIIILILTNGMLTFFVSRGIIKPLNFLKTASDEIKNGNLDFKIDYKSKDEIGQLCKAFEEMRVRLKESEVLKQEYETNRKELIANISHDLKTPISSIINHVEGIVDGVADSPDKIEKYMKTIYAKSYDINKMIDELFLFSKLDLNKEPFKFEKVDIVSFMDYFVEELSFELEASKIELQFAKKLSSDSVNSSIMADREKIKRVLTNIVQNSIKYMDSEGCIAINLNVGDEKATISIKDNGKGISSKDLAFIFDKFYRTDESRNTSTGGSGLGLAIAKRIIEEHNGRVWAESEEGKYTEIFISLNITEN